MSEYIKREDALEVIKPYLDNIDIIPFYDAKPYVREAVCGIRAKIKSIPAIEHRRGEWKEWIDPKYEIYWQCSACGAASEAFAAKELYKYCPFCGADMREREGE